jgi:hypothetical protein
MEQSIPETQLTVLQTAIAHITGRLEKCMTPQPMAVILTGSFARGEGSVLRMQNRARVLGDMEFMVLCPPRSDLRTMQKQLRQEATQSTYDLAKKGIDCEIEFSAVDPKYLYSLRPQIFGYEFLNHGCVVWGDPDTLRTAPRFPASAIPLWDAWRMLNNRLLEQLQWVEAVTLENRTLLEPIFYQTIKCYLDLGTSLLIFGKRYKSTYASRAAALMRWAREEPRNALLSTISRAVAECTEFKLSPRIGRRVLGVRFDTTAEELRPDIQKMVVNFVRDAHEVWRWQACQLVGRSVDSDSDAKLTQEVLATQGWKEKARGWAKIALMPNVRRQCRFAKRMRSLCRSGSPRYLIYSVAAELCFTIPAVMAGCEPDIAALELLLPVAFIEHENEMRPWWRLRANVLSAWKLFLRNEWA